MEKSCEAVSSLFSSFARGASAHDRRKSTMCLPENKQRAFVLSRTPSCGRFKVFIRTQKKIGNIFPLLWLFFYFSSRPSHVKLFSSRRRISADVIAHTGLINSCVNLLGEQTSLVLSLVLDWGHELWSEEATLREVIDGLEVKEAFKKLSPWKMIQNN